MAEEKKVQSVSEASQPKPKFDSSVEKFHQITLAIQDYSNLN